MECKPKFKVGDVINSSLSGPSEIIEIRLGVPTDFPTYTLANGQPFRVSWEGEPCYIMRHCHGLQGIHACGVECIDSDHHLKGTELFNAYERVWDELQADFLKRQLTSKA
jgi:hypothetical protein